MLKIIQASIDDLNEVIIHYKTVIDQIKNYDYRPGWKFGVHPTKERIKNALNQGQLYVGKLNSKIVASLILDKEPLEANDKVSWPYNFKDDEIMYIHLVAVNQDYKNRGLAKQMLTHIFDIAKSNSIKSIRLSLNMNNIAIEKLYLKTGFRYIATERVFIEKRGFITFNMYEKIL